MLTALLGAGGVAVALGALSYFLGFGKVIGGIADVVFGFLTPVAKWLGEMLPVVGSKLYDGAAYTFRAGRGTLFVVTVGALAYFGGDYHGAEKQKAVAQAKVLQDLHAKYVFTPRPVRKWTPPIKGLW